MTNKEIFESYANVFIMAIEIAGEEISNEQYRNIRPGIEKFISNDQIKHDIEFANIDFKVFVSLLCAHVITVVHGDKCCDITVEETHSIISYMWDNYLAIPTRKFTSMYGLPTITDLDSLVLKIIKPEDIDKYEK